MPHRGGHCPRLVFHTKPRRGVFARFVKADSALSRVDKAADCEKYGEEVGVMETVDLVVLTGGSGPGHAIDGHPFVGMPKCWLMKFAEWKTGQKWRSMPHRPQQAYKSLSLSHTRGLQPVRW